jgi:hypothetical protein
MGMDRLRAHALAGSCCGLGLQPETRNCASPCPSAPTACSFGAQAFEAATRFNADIGAWNTAAVTTLAYVCAAPGPAARIMADALGRASMRRGRLCAAAPPMRARVRTRAGTRLRGGLGCRYGQPEGRFDTCMRTYIRVCVCVFHAYAYIIHLSVNVRIGRGYVCVHQCAMGMDRLCAHALAGSCCGLGRNPNPKPCEPLPVGVDRVRLLRAGVQMGVGVQRQHRRVEHRGRHHVVLGMRRSLPGGAHYGGRARRGFGAARPVVRGGTSDARARAHTCKHSLARGVGCRYGRAEGRFDACNRIFIYMCVCACVCYMLIHTLSIFMYMREPAGVMRACTSARWVMDRLCAHALAGSCCGLGLKPETRNRASRCPSESTACGFGAQAFVSASAFNADIGVWNTASVSNMAGVCAAPGPVACTTADALGEASMRCGRLCAAAPPMRARVCTHLQALACAGSLSVGTAARRRGSIHVSE